MVRIIQIITLLFFSLLMMSSSCDKGTEGCTDNSLCDYQGDGIIDENCACNYDKDAIVDDGSCSYPEENYDCGENCLIEVDCAGDCGGDAELDCCGVCDLDLTNNPPVGSNGDCAENVQCGCTDNSKCNFTSNATNNDGSCAGDLSEFGGLSDGNDCYSECEGAAVVDECDLCVGGSTNLGQSWRIKINSIATFKLQDDTSMGADTNSVTLGTSIFALDGYNGTEIGGGDPSCENCYIDFPEPKLTGFEDKNNLIRFYFPHDASNEWDEWGSQIDFDIDPLFDRDIRESDNHSLFTEEKGLNWFAIVEPTLTDTIIFDEFDNATPIETILDSIYFKISHLESIKCSYIKIILDREKGDTEGGVEYLVENNQLGIKVDTDKSFSVMINVSNICIQEFEETCPDDF